MEVSAENSIKKFYDESEIFITGGSGFVGRVLIEKLLRTCKGIKKIYLLMRGKKGVEARNRIDKLVDCKLFDTLRSTDPHSFEKLSVVEGNAKELRLGLSNSDYEKVKKCSIFFHCAASVRFDDPINYAILLNTRGTQEVCKIAEENKNLKALVHVSTTFIQPRLFGLEESFYPADCDWRKMIKFAETFDIDMMCSLERKITKFAPNTYTFSKHLAEQVCRYYKESKNLPISILRPSIISCSEVEPFPGWCDNLYGPMSFMIAGSVGINHVSLVDGDCRLDYIPVDMCVKGIIVTAWKTWKENNETKIIPTYNASGIKKVTFNILESTNIIQENPPKDAIMYLDHQHVKCAFYAWIVRIIEQLIPAIIVDGILMGIGQKTKLMKVQRVLYDSYNNLTAFSSKNFNFSNHKYLDLHQHIPDAEKEDFFIYEKYPQIMKQINEGYLVLLEVILNQKAEDMPKARRRYKYVIFISRLYQIAAYSGLIYFVMRFLIDMIMGIDFNKIFEF